MKKTTKLLSLFVLAAASLALVAVGHAQSGGPAGTVSIAKQIPDGHYTGTAGELVSLVIANELSDRERLD